MVQTVKPPPVPPPPPELLTGTAVAGADVGSGDGSVVLVGRGVDVGMRWVGCGFKVAGGIGVRVGRRVGGTGVGVGSAPHAAAIRTSETRASRENRKMSERGINDLDENNWWAETSGWIIAWMETVVGKR
jgi:hypothetical protein